MFIMTERIQIGGQNRSEGFRRSCIGVAPRSEPFAQGRSNVCGKIDIEVLAMYYAGDRFDSAADKRSVQTRRGLTWGLGEHVQRDASDCRPGEKNSAAKQS